MPDLIGIAGAILSESTRAVDASAQNIANLTTPGYKRRSDFAQWLSPAGAADPTAVARRTAVDFTSGKTVQTGNPYDLALAGAGFLTLRGADGDLLYTRNGQLNRDGEGRLVDGHGRALQADGGDLVLRGGKVEIQPDGVVLEDGAPTARLDLVQFRQAAAASPAADGGFVAPDDAVEPSRDARVQQGAVEASNVSSAAEMVQIMSALRRAEAGQRLATVYDDLMGRAISSFGQGQ